MFVHLIVWSLLIVCIEKGLFKICRINWNAKVVIEADDDDVLSEAARVKSG